MIVRRRIATLVYCWMMPAGELQVWLKNRFMDTGNYAWLLLWSPVRAYFTLGVAIHRGLIGGYDGD